MSLKKKINLLVATVCFVLTGVAFQNCSVGQFNSNSFLSKSTELQNTASLQTGFIAPNSNTGTSTSVILAATGEKVIIAKEYRHKTFDRYFITTRKADQTIVEPGGALGNEWESTGNTYSLNDTQVAGTSPLCRFYIPATKTHFYSADVNECAQLRNNTAFVYEGIEGYAVKINPGAICTGTAKAVYRAYSNTNVTEQKRHRYTASSGTLSNLVSQGWLDEGISFCAADVYITGPVNVTPPIVVVPPPNPPVTPPSTCVKPARFVDQSLDPCEDFGPYPSDVQAYCACRFTGTPPVTTNNSCLLNGTTVVHGASITAYQAASATTCSSQLRTCSNGVLSGSYAYSSCTPSVSSGSASCAFASSTIPHGSSVIGYASATVPFGSSCASQQVSCSNGSLSTTSYPFGSCSVLPQVVTGPTTDYCPSIQPLNGFQFNASPNYLKVYTGQYAANSRGIDSTAMSSLGSIKLEDQTQVVIKLVVSAADSTLGRYPATFSYAEIGANHGTQFVTISKSKCDFSQSAFWVGQTPSASPIKTLGGSGSFSINEAGKANASSGASFDNLTTGTWYINIKNFGTNCNVPASGNWCNFLMEFNNM